MKEKKLKLEKIESLSEDRLLQLLTKAEFQVYKETTTKISEILSPMGEPRLKKEFSHKEETTTSYKVYDLDSCNFDIGFKDLVSIAKYHIEYISQDKLNELFEEQIEEDKKTALKNSLEKKLKGK